jgi:hypothetical protein
MEGWMDGWMDGVMDILVQKLHFVAWHGMWRNRLRRGIWKSSRLLKNRDLKGASYMYIDEFLRSYDMCEYPEM